MLAFVAGRREAVEQADPEEVTRAFGIADNRIAGSDRDEPGPASGDGEGTGEEALERLPRRIADSLQGQRREQHRRERMAPEGDQRMHAGLGVSSTDMG